VSGFQVNVKDLMKKATVFHGHLCPGIAIGVLAAKYALEQGYEHSLDEEIVAVVETDSCSIDALQILLGTTFGKGNLVHLDYGKNNFSFYNRKTQKGIRLALKKEISNYKNLSRDEKIQKLLELEPEDVFDIREIEFNPPGLALIDESVFCEVCGEKTMESRIMDYQGKSICIPCYKELRK
jgi:formylmethanofuran dehydrogenase subunit E